jgi:hypothetical protein
VKQAQDVYDRTVGSARDIYIRSLKRALDVALAGKNLDEANRINAVIKSEQEKNAAPSGETSKNVEARLKLASNLAGTKWLVGTRGEVFALKGDGTGQSSSGATFQWSAIDGNQILLFGVPDDPRGHPIRSIVRWTLNAELTRVAKDTLGLESDRPTDLADGHRVK